MEFDKPETPSTPRPPVGERPLKAALGAVAELDMRPRGEADRVNGKKAKRQPGKGRPTFLANLNVLKDDMANLPRHAAELGARVLSPAEDRYKPDREAAVPLDKTGDMVEINLQQQEQEHADIPPTPPSVAEYRQILWPKAAETSYVPHVQPNLEAAPLHDLPAQETSRKTVVPIAVETHPVAKRPEHVVNERNVNELSRSELLKIAKDIKIDGVNLKDVYHAKRIDEEGLRAVVETYLRGGDVKRQLSEEIIAKEQSFERDPFLRQQRAGGQLQAMMGGATMVARGLLQDKGGKLATVSRKQAKKAGRVLAGGAKQAQRDLIDNSNTTDWISITAIVIVYGLILLLLFK